jgi:hypothetical protein
VVSQREMGYRRLLERFEIRDEVDVVARVRWGHDQIGLRLWREDAIVSGVGERGRTVSVR